MIFKEYVRFLNREPDIKPLSLTVQIMRHIPLVDETRCWLPVEAIRLFTFEALGIGHTCCEYRIWSICLKEDEERKEAEVARRERGEGLGGEKKQEETEKQAEEDARRLEEQFDGKMDLEEKKEEKTGTSATQHY